jgi:hypothetical protein
VGREQAQGQRVNEITIDYHEHIKEHYGKLAPENEENAAFRAEATQDLLGTAKNATRPTSRPKTVAKVHLA